MGKQYTDIAKKVLELAREEAFLKEFSYVGTEHLLLGLLKVKEGLAYRALFKQKVDIDKIYEKMEIISKNESDSMNISLEFSPRTDKILLEAEKEANMMEEEYVGSEHILISLIKDKECMASRLIMLMGIKRQKLIGDIYKSLGLDVKEAQNSLNKNSNSKTPVLDQYGTDLTNLAESDKFDPIIGREDELERIIQILSRRTKNSPCMVGEPGVGKTAIAEGLAKKIVNEEVPESLVGHRLYRLDIASMLAGAKFRGDFEARIKKCIEEIINAGNILLFIDELHTLIGAGASEGSVDASNILKPALARGEVQIIGATTYDEYRKYIERDLAFERRFQPVEIEETTIEETEEILNGIKAKLCEHHSVIIDDEAIIEAARLSDRYITERFLPDKAIDVLDEACSKVRLNRLKVPEDIRKLEEDIKELEQEKEDLIVEKKYEKAKKINEDLYNKRVDLDVEKNKWTRKLNSQKVKVTGNDVAEVICDWTGIPVAKLTTAESKKLKDLEKDLHKRVVGQDEAISSISKAVRRGRIGLKDPNRPVGSFLMLGPTGVGKTELCKALAETLFDEEEALIRIDMSEYMEKHSVSKIIGSPPGYVGYDEGGQLSEMVRRNPYSVVLFDEIEKAHPDVFNILLQILDDGHITDSKGKLIDFKNTVIIMTSNIGARNIVSPTRLGFTQIEEDKEKHKDMKKNVMDEVKKIFRPEFVNRIDDIIVFHTLSKENIENIVTIMFDRLAKRVDENLGIVLKLGIQAKRYLAKEGYSEAYGARPLKRAIQNKIEDELAILILDEKFKDGDEVRIGYSKGEITFKKVVKKKK